MEVGERNLLSFICLLKQGKPNESRLLTVRFWGQAFYSRKILLCSDLHREGLLELESTHVSSTSWNELLPCSSKEKSLFSQQSPTLIFPLCRALVHTKACSEMPTPVRAFKFHIWLLHNASAGFVVSHCLFLLLLAHLSPQHAEHSWTSYMVTFWF